MAGKKLLLPSVVNNCEISNVPLAFTVKLLDFSQRQEELERTPWSDKLRSKAAWADAASYTMADLTMLRRELVIGYLVAGLLAVVVPMETWNAVFIKGHGEENFYDGAGDNHYVFNWNPGDEGLGTATIHGWVSK